MLRRLLIAAVCLLPSASFADGFGWHLTSFNHETLAYVFGGQFRQSHDYLSVRSKFREETLRTQGEEEAEKLLPVFDRMTAEGWRDLRDEHRNLDQWYVASELINGKYVEEFAAEEFEDWVSMQAIEAARAAVSAEQARILGPFSFGREIGSATNYQHCAGIPKRYRNIVRGGCSPSYILFSPDEVKTLLQTVQTALTSRRFSRFDKAKRYSTYGELKQFAADLQTIANRNHALLMNGFD